MGTNLIEVARATGAQWKALSEEEKAPYRARQQELSAKFTLTREAYNEYCKGRSSKKHEDISGKKSYKKNASKRVATKKTRPAKVPPQSKQFSEAATFDATQPMATMPALESSASVASTQPEANAGQRRRAFKMPDEAGVVPPVDPDATQLADPVAAAAWE